MNSAETINKGNLKLAIFPTVLFGKNGGDSVWGVAGRFGYGLTRSVDIEAKVGFFKGLKYFGADIEYLVPQGRNFNGSAALGGHMTDYDGGGDSNGIDASLLFSHKPVAKPGDLRRPHARFRVGQEHRTSTTPGSISCPGSSTASATTSISWPRSASPSTPTPAAMPAWDWRCTFCAEASGLIR